MNRKLLFAEKIQAPRADVWATLFGSQESFSAWTSVLLGGPMQFKGDWTKGSEMEFFSPGHEFLARFRVVDCVVNARLKLETIAVLQGGKSNKAYAGWIGASDEYDLFDYIGDGGGTLLAVEAKYPDSHDEFMQKFPRTLQKIKSLAEAQE